jgi:hypothetical protein
MGLRDRFLTPKLIQNAFRVTGISPLNPDVFTKEDYAPSQAFSIKAHVPKTYPDNVPSSDPAIATDHEDGDSSDDGDYEESEFETRPMILSGDGDGDGMSDSELPDDEPASESGDSTSETERESSTTASQKEAPIRPRDMDSDRPTIRITRSMVRSISMPLESPIPPIELDKLHQLTKEDLITHVLNMQGRVFALEHELQNTNAMRQSSESHCTLAKRMIEDANTRLDNANKKKNRGTVKIKARIVVAPELQESFEREEREADMREREAKEREHTKAVEAAERDRRIVEAAISKTYDAPLSSYKLKEDLVGLARALKIVDTGTVANLTERIKQHLHDNPNLVHNPRFSGLFNSRRQTRRAPSPPQPESIPSLAGPSFQSIPNPAQSTINNQFSYYNYLPYTTYS